VTGRVCVRPRLPDVVDLMTSPTDAEQMIFECLLEDRLSVEDVRDHVWQSGIRQSGQNGFIFRQAQEEAVWRLVWGARYSNGEPRISDNPPDLDAMAEQWGTLWLR
jgi:hypothetical protein